jgi:hypothetical protein
MLGCLGAKHDSSQQRQGQWGLYLEGLGRQQREVRLRARELGEDQSHHPSVARLGSLGQLGDQLCKQGGGLATA